MTQGMMDLHVFVGKRPDADFLREMIGFAATPLIELEVGALTGAGDGEKVAQRLASLGGYRNCDWKARGHRRATHPQASQRQLLSRIP